MAFVALPLQLIQYLTVSRPALHIFILIQQNPLTSDKHVEQNVIFHWRQCMFWNNQNIFVPVSSSLEHVITFHQKKDMGAMKYLNGYNEHVLTIVLISLSVFCTKLLLT